MSLPASAAARSRSASGFREAIWPSPEQELLLRATLERREPARAAWQAWQQLPQQELDAGSSDLLPLLYSSLCRMGVADPVLEPLARIQRRVRRENERRLAEAGAALRALRRAGLPTLLLKGACLLPDYYRDLGARSLGDVDVAVPCEDAERAIAVLVEAGFRPNKALSPASLRFRHSANFSNRSGTSVDLHWRVLFESSGDQSFWDAATPGDLAGVPTRLPDPADLLFLVLAHGVKWGTAPSLHWIADAVTLIRSEGRRLDWQRVVAQAARHRVSLRVRAGLRYLAERMGASVPATVLAALDAIPTGRMERAESSRRLADGSRATAALELVWVDYWRLQSGAGLLRALRELPSYVCFRLQRLAQARAIERGRRRAAAARSSSQSSPKLTRTSCSRPT